MSCEQERFANGARVTEDKGVRLVFHFAGSGDRAIVFDDEWAYERVDNASIAKWQVFMDGGRINHIVNMDNVTFVEVVDDD